MKKPEEFDVIILGSGQAGNPLALTLAAEKWKVALVEKGKLGGTCVNTGCTPTKTYVASARRAWAVNHAKELGIKVPISPQIDMMAVKARKDKLVEASHRGVSKSLADEKNITLLQAKGYFTDNHTIQAGSRVLTAPRIVVNVGARTHVPEGFSDVDFLTHETILQLTEVPKHLLIVGGSYIALEFAQIFRRLGGKITVVEKGDRLITREDPETSRLVQEILESEGIRVLCSAECIEGKDRKGGGVTVTMDCSGRLRQVSGSHLLLATGRKPNTDTLKLENTGVATDKKGYISVDDTLESSEKGIFALGDCNGRGAFTHTAYHDFEILKDQWVGSGKKTLAARITTYALYTDPPMGRAGMTIGQARDSGKNLLYASMDMKNIARAKEKGETQGKMEVIVDETTRHIIGAMVLGTGGDEIIAVFLTAMYGKLDYKVLMDAVIPHPTVAELIPTLLQKLEKIS